MMIPTITILFIDHDRYFAEGFRLGVTQYFRRRNINVTYTENIAHRSSADMIFLAMDLGRKNSHCYNFVHPSRQCLFLIKGRYQTQRSYPSFLKRSAGIISREQSLASVFTLLDLALLKYNENYQITHRRDEAIRQPVLTYREYEVMRYLFFGMNNHAISHQLNISEKTVSSHKRAAMRKLNLTQNIELNYWLLNGGLNGVKVFNSHQPSTNLHVMH